MNQIQFSPQVRAHCLRDGPRHFSRLHQWPEGVRQSSSRGQHSPFIDEAALVQALDECKVAGAALDVFEIEPLPLDSPLRHFDQCIFGTHNSSNTQEAVLRVNELAIANLLEGLRTTPL